MTLEEKIARVIDPQAFDPESGIYINSAGVHLVESRRSDQQSALQKAKAILSLLPNTGEREKALEEMEDRAKLAEKITRFHAICGEITEQPGRMQGQRA